MKTCTKCATENDGPAKFCIECGTPLPTASIKVNGTLLDSDEKTNAEVRDFDGTLVDEADGDTHGLATDRPALTITDRYEIVEELGRGGMSVVYLARDMVLGRNVALKKLLPHVSKKQKAVARLMVEARAVAGLQHPNIVALYDIGETEDGPFIAMELVAAQNHQPLTLEEKIKTDGPLGEKKGADLVTKLCRGVQHAHDYGVIHRDIKPSNILLTRDGDPKLVDFGIAHATADTVGGTYSGLTQEGSTLGTPDFMAPEQEGNAGNVDERADVYALGGILYFCMTGRTMRYFRESDATGPLREVLLMAVDPDKTKRFSSVADFRRALTIDLLMVGSTVEESSKSFRSLPKKQKGMGHMFDVDLVEIAPGSFQMGADNGTNNDAVHEVRISNKYWMTKYPVTQGLYEAVMGKNPSFFKKEYVVRKGFMGVGRDVVSQTKTHHPVECVSWMDAVAFCRKLTEKETSNGNLKGFPGYVYRLPTEAEWEYAARGGERTQNFAFSGSDNADEVAWFAGNSRGTTHEVGTKKNNELGLSDMSGNVWEWCHDSYDDNYYQRSSQIDPVNVSSKNNVYRVVRGGSYNFTRKSALLSCRDREAADNPCEFVGFRLVLAPTISSFVKE